MNTTFEQFTHECSSFRLVPVMKRIFADTTTPIQIFQKLSHDAVCLLESNDASSDWARYSFIGLNPDFELIEGEESFQLRNRLGEKLLEDQNFVNGFQRSFELLNPSPATDSGVPFPGGAVGVMPYDSIKHFEKTLRTNEGEDLEPVHFVFCKTMIAFDHQQSTISIIHYVDTEQSKDHRSLYEKAQANVNTIIKQLEQPSHTDSLQHDFSGRLQPDFTDVRSNYERSEFLAAVDKIKDYIHQGDVFQAVLSQRFEYETNASAFMIYRVLRRLNPSPYMFFLKLGTKEIVGSSPEKLVEVRDEEVEIHPIAGTRKRGRNQEEDEALAKEMLASEKERAEHQMLIDLARNDVGRVAEYGSVSTPVIMDVGKFSHVMHIISIVVGKLRKDVHPLSALIAGFPAGTLSGAPKVRAMEILQELEPTNRGIYAGGIAYMSYNKDIDSCIAIRTMVIENGTAKVQAGAGIVADSIPDEEYEETINKASALFSAIQTAEAMNRGGAASHD